MRCTSTSTEHFTITSVPKAGAESPHYPGRQVALLTRTFHSQWVCPAALLPAPVLRGNLLSVLGGAKLRRNALTLFLVQGQL